MNDQTEQNNKTQEQAPAPEPSEASNTFAVKKPQQKTINVVGGAVIATLTAIVIAQAVSDNNQFSPQQVRFQGGPNGQMQGPGPNGQQGMQGPGMQGPGMQGPGMQAPGMGPQGQGGHKRHEDRGENQDAPEDKTNKDDEKTDDRDSTG